MKKLLAPSIFVLLALAACRHSPPSGEAPVPESPVVAQYTASTPEGDVKLTLDSAVGDTVTLALETVAAPSFSGAAFKISYDPAALQYIGHESGSLLEASAAPIYASAKVNDVEGKIAVGATLKRGDTMASGNGIVIKLKFKAIARGSTALTFTENVLRDSAFAEVGGLTWTAGTITGL